MNTRPALIILFLFFLSSTAFAQQPDTLIKKLDSLSKKTDSAGGQTNNTNTGAYNNATQITFSSYFLLLGSNLKQSFTKPFHMTKKDWGIALKFGLTVGALSFADKPIQREGLKLRNENAGLRNISKDVTNFGGLYEVYTLGALGAYGYIFKNKKMQTTTLLASQSYITAGALESVLKFLTGRNRPYISDSSQVQKNPTFHGPFFKKTVDANGKKLNSSFPSGHTTAAFAAATVYALEYSNKPIIPIIAYSAATLIGLSRITENKHWATDVLTGAAIGFLTGKQIVNNYHRYAKLKSPKQKNTITFTLNYDFGVMMPGFVYTFR